MKKVVKVNYPKKKPRLKLEDLGDVQEPERESMYQVMLNNLKIANRATFIHRIIYVGSHTFPSFDYAKDLFSGIITRANETYCIEKLTGFFLFYSQYFVHMVEGDEDNLNKHLSYLLAKNAAHSKYLGTIKLLIHVSNINQRFFEDWVTFTGAASKLLERLDTNADLGQSGRHIFNCIKKLYMLMGAYAEDISAVPEGFGGHMPKSELKVRMSTADNPSDTRLFPSTSYSSEIDQMSSLGAKEYKLALPEYELLEFVLQSSFTMTLQEYFNLYGVVPMRDIYKDRVWPVPHDFIPYDIFEKPYDCVTELPKTSRTKKRKEAQLNQTGSEAYGMDTAVQHEAEFSTPDESRSEIRLQEMTSGVNLSSLPATSKGKLSYIP